MLLVEDADDRSFLMTLFESLYDELPAPKPKRSRKAES